MKVEGPQSDPAFLTRRIAELEALLAQPADSAKRVCPGCTVTCPRCGSTSCTCVCSPGCPAAPAALSSDPARHPVEPGIVSLVYAMNTLRLLPTCWSCEGHEATGGRPSRPPQLWFHSRAVSYPALLQHYLAELRLARLLSCAWGVRVVDWGGTVDTAFAIEPAMGVIGGGTLEQLQSDARTIAAGLVAGVRRAAHEFIGRLRAVRPAG